MKVINITCFIVPFLLVTLLSRTFFLVKAQDVAEPVLDVSGNAVRRGVNYYILPAGRGNGGGLQVASIRNQTNPLVVSQNADESVIGVNVQFSPVDPKENTVRLSIDMNVKFTSMVISDSSTVWRINTELIPERYLVTIGGVEGNPGRETLGNWFNIDKPFCGEIGILEENGKRVLFVGRDPPLKVAFHKV
ncbi:hypothetical protein R3W88_009268 [Solanum pinnatisectum]|uniref:Uncharacterized protein n=1 Tax=Solanum pinnatisectum TaxID=50273 RepID=A0AAV9MAS9_9SOLN|nr:hypothetical protein R3W88_009268 [Solanum pinnatisectum]